MVGGIFDFLLSAPYEDRAVARWANDDESAVVDTCKVVDGKLPVETAVCHPDYNDGDWMIVEAYASIEAALVGHERWVRLVQSDELPDVIADCCNAHCASFAEELSGDAEVAGLVYRRKHAAAAAATSTDSAAPAPEEIQ